jgi:heme oxygenase
MEFNIMAMLKDATHDQHMAIHENPLILAILSGEITKDQYSAQLCQLYHVHERLEDLLGCENEIIGECVWQDQMRSELLEEDLEFLIQDDYFKGLEISEKTCSLLDYFDYKKNDEASSLLGAVYVFEGAAAGGGNILASRLEEKFNLNGRGVCYLKGFDNPKEKFAEFGERMNENVIDDEIKCDVISVAQRTFYDMDLIYREIMEKY